MSKNKGPLTIIIKGFSWMFALRMGTRIVAFIRIAVLARILNPVQFGVFGVAGLVLSFLDIVTEVGTRVLLIQKRGYKESLLNTVWTLSIIRGVAVSLLIYLSSPLISLFFKSPESLRLLRLIAFVPLIKGFINPIVIRYQKSFEFNKEFIFRFVIYAVDSIVCLIVAFSTKNATSLVWGLIAGAVFELISSYLLFNERPRFSFNIKSIKYVFNRGRWVTMYGIFNYMFENGDDIVVGKLLNTFSLGIYQMAYKISILPLSEISEVLIKVTFPVYSKYNKNRLRLKKLFYRNLLAVSLSAIVLGSLIYALADIIVKVLLGNSWVGTVEIIKILSLFGILRAIMHPFYSLFLAVNKQEYVAMGTLVNVLAMGVIIIPMVKYYGILGAVYSVIISSIAVIPFILYKANRIFNKTK